MKDTLTKYIIAVKYLRNFIWSYLKTFNEFKFRWMEFFTDWFIDDCFFATENTERHLKIDNDYKEGFQSIYELFSLERVD